MTRGGDDRADKGRPVYQIDIKTLRIIKEFPSALNAQRETGAKCVYACCSRLETYKQFIVTGNSYWCFVDDWSESWKPKSGRINYIDSDGNKICDCGDKQICQIDKNGKLVAIFKTATEAEKNTGVGCSNICRVCRKESLSSGGYYWCYKKDLDTFELPHRKPLSAFGAKKIRCIETNTIYDSIRIAGKVLGIHYSSILQVLNGKRNKTKGFHFEYVG